MTMTMISLHFDRHTPKKIEQLTQFKYAEYPDMHLICFWYLLQGPDRNDLENTDIFKRILLRTYTADSILELITRLSNTYS